MISYILLFVSIVLGVCKSAVYNVYAKQTKPGLLAVFRFNAVTYGTAACIALAAVLLGDETISLPTVLWALVYAAVVFSLQTISITAMKVGAMALTSVCVMYGMIIPSLAGPLFWREPFGVLQAVGICMMLVSLWLLQGKGDGNEKTAVSKKWVAMAATAFLLSGMAGVIEKAHQSGTGRDEKSLFVFVGCVLMLALSGAACTVTGKGADVTADKKALLSLGAISGCIIGFYYLTNLTLAGTLDSMIYYPVANGGAMVLTVLAARLIFREPLDRYQIFGTVMGLLGIVCLSIPI